MVRKLSLDEATAWMAYSIGEKYIPYKEENTHTCPQFTFLCKYTDSGSIQILSILFMFILPTVLLQVKQKKRLIN